MVMLFYLLACGRYTQQGETDCGLDIWLANKFHKKIRLPFNYPIHYLASNADQEKTEETLKKVLVKNDPRLSVQAKRLYCFCAPLCCCCWAFIGLKWLKGRLGLLTSLRFHAIAISDISTKASSPISFTATRLRAGGVAPKTSRNTALTIGFTRRSVT